jgi:hypothetical protein
LCFFVLFDTNLQTGFLHRSSASGKSSPPIRRWAPSRSFFPAEREGQISADFQTPLIFDESFDLQDSAEPLFGDDPTDGLLAKSASFLSMMSGYEKPQQGDLLGMCALDIRPLMLSNHFFQDTY